MNLVVQEWIDSALEFGRSVPEPKGRLSAEIHFSLPEYCYAKIPWMNMMLTERVFP